MNINPISFGKIIKVTGNNPLAVAQKISSKNQNSASFTTNGNKSAYIVTDKDYVEINSYYKDMMYRIKYTANRGSEEASKIATEIEFDRFLDKTKMQVLGREDMTIDAYYDEDSDKILSFEIQKSM